jgi:hypothetical protein
MSEQTVKEFPRLRLQCSGKRSGGERHTFYLPGFDRRLGKIEEGRPVQVACPLCGEAVTGGIVEYGPTEEGGNDD